jgi:hypothetical protein
VLHICKSQAFLFGWQLLSRELGKGLTSLGPLKFLHRLFWLFTLDLFLLFWFIRFLGDSNLRDLNIVLANQPGLSVIGLLLHLLGWGWFPPSFCTIPRGHPLWAHQGF